MGRIKVLSVFGTRPDTIKLAPVVAELSRHPGEDMLCDCGDCAAP